MKMLVGVAVATLMLSACGGASSSDPIKSGVLDVTVQCTPDPPRVGRNELGITLRSRTGDLLAGANITVDPQMPAHGHGSTETAVVEDLGQGRYHAAPLTFQMPGRWEVTVSADADGDSGSVLLTFDVN